MADLLESEKPGGRSGGKLNRAQLEKTTSRNTTRNIHLAADRTADSASAVSTRPTTFPTLNSQHAPDVISQPLPNAVRRQN
jgi:hypothetical protein